MINRVERGGFNYLESITKDRQRKRKQAANSGVVVEITTLPDTNEEILDPNRLEKIKKLIKEGKYPLDHQKLAEKIVDFLIDGK